MIRTTLSLASLVTLIGCWGMSTEVEAAGNKEWKIQITPRFVANSDSTKTRIPVTRSTVFKTAQAETEAPTAAVPPPVEQPAVKAPAALPVIKPRHSPMDTELTNYGTVYNSIPFSRSEYLANPSYRHETTVSILLGQPYVTNGPKKIAPRVQPAVRTSPWSKTTPGYYHSGGYLSPYHYRPYHSFP